MSKSREARKEIVAQVNEKLQKMNEIPAQNFMQIVKALSNTAVLDLIVQTIKTERVELASQQKVKDLKSKAEVIKKVTEKADEKKDEPKDEVKECNVKECSKVKEDVDPTEVDVFDGFEDKAEALAFYFNLIKKAKFKVQELTKEEERKKWGTTKLRI